MALFTRVRMTGLIVMIGYMKEGMRHGEGVQVWPDGAKYEGYWMKN